MFSFNYLKNARTNIIILNLRNLNYLKFKKCEKNKKKKGTKIILQI